MKELNIGLDIDNVISAFDSKILQEFMLEDANKRNAGIIDKKARYITKGMFDWSEEEIDDFLNNNMENFAKELKTRKYCKKYMDLLLNDGHKLILITHRVFPHYNNPEKTTLDWLNKRNINYTKLVFSESSDKTKECFEYKVDVMIDDRVGQCAKMLKNGVKCFIMQTKYNKREIGDLPFVTSWKDLYEEICKLC